MSESKLSQLQYESDTWKRLLGFMRDENIHLKNMLSEVLKNKFDNNLLEEAESFHNSFLKEDDLIGLLRNEVAELDKLLERRKFEDSKTINEIDKRKAKLHDNIITAETQFSNLKSAFNNYLSGINNSNKNQGKLIHSRFEITPRRYFKRF